MSTKTALDFPYIRAWHYGSGSMSYYVDEQVARARKEKAPADTCYFAVDPDRPVTASEILARDPDNAAVAACKKWIEARQG